MITTNNHNRPGQQGNSLGTSLGLGSGIAWSCYTQGLPSQQLPLALCFPCLHQHPVVPWAASHCSFSSAVTFSWRMPQKWPEKVEKLTSREVTVIWTVQVSPTSCCLLWPKKEPFTFFFYVIHLTCLKQITISIGVLQSPWLLHCLWASIFASLEVHTGCAAEKQSQWVNILGWYQQRLDQRAQLIH